MPRTAQQVVQAGSTAGSGAARQVTHASSTTGALAARATRAVRRRIVVFMLGGERTAE